MRQIAGLRARPFDHLGSPHLASGAIVADDEITPPSRIAGAPGKTPGSADARTRAAVVRVPRDLDAIAVGNGPGPFTGLRVGLVTAVTMGHALGIPVHGVCSLDVLAVQARRPEGELLVATDARRKEVYVASYAEGRRVSGPDVVKPADVAVQLIGVRSLGSPDSVAAPAMPISSP